MFQSTALGALLLMCAIDYTGALALQDRTRTHLIAAGAGEKVEGKVQRAEKTQNAGGELAPPQFKSLEAIAATTASVSSSDGATVVAAAEKHEDPGWRSGDTEGVRAAIPGERATILDPRDGMLHSAVPGLSGNVYSAPPPMGGSGLALAGKPEVRCSGDYGSKIGDAVCCNQPGTINFTRSICNGEAPLCHHFVQGSSDVPTVWGNCTNTNAAKEHVVRCLVPYPEQGSWTDCFPGQWRDKGETCDWVHEFGHTCKYDDGPIPCDLLGTFEKDRLGPQKCTKLKAPRDKLGCARFDMDQHTCVNTEGCDWDDRSFWCQIACRATPVCGVELHRKDLSCMFNCPLDNPTICHAWQAGCNCIQDTTIIECGEWCMENNGETFNWLKHRQSRDLSGVITVGDALAFAQTDAGGYDPLTLCRDACFSRGVCVSPPAVLEGSGPGPGVAVDTDGNSIGDDDVA